MERKTAEFKAFIQKYNTWLLCVPLVVQTLINHSMMENLAGRNRTDIKSHCHFFQPTHIQFTLWELHWFTCLGNCLCADKKTPQCCRVKTMAKKIFVIVQAKRVQPICSEASFLKYGFCLLLYINPTEFLREKKIKWEALNNTHLIPSVPCKKPSLIKNRLTKL